MQVAGLGGSYGRAPHSQTQGCWFKSQQFLLMSKMRQGSPMGGGAKIPGNPREKPFLPAAKPSGPGTVIVVVV